jgi:hypothetical protein
VYATIQAESCDAQSGTVAEPTSDTGDGQDLGWSRYGYVALTSGQPTDVVNVNYFTFSH